MRVNFSNTISNNIRINNTQYKKINLSNCSVPANDTVSFNAAKCKGVDTNSLSFINRIKNLFSKNKNYQKILDKIPHFTISEYKQLSQEEIDVLRKKYNSIKSKTYGKFSLGLMNIPLFCKYKFKEIEGIHRQAVDSMKSVLDEKYGEGNYTVIIIGRSLSSIGKTLGYRIGENNVINIPLSNAFRYCSPKYLKKIAKNGHVKNLKNFLKGKGLTKDKIIHSGKKYVIMDYCSSGKSLEGAETLLTYLFGKNEKNENIETLDIIKYIKNENFKKKLTKILTICGLKPIAFVKRCEFIKNVSRSETPIDKLDCKYKLLLFKLLDNEMNYDKIK